MKKYKVKDLYLVKLGNKTDFLVKMDKDGDFFIALGIAESYYDHSFILLTKNNIRLTNQRQNVGQGGKMLSLAIPLALYIGKDKDALTIDEINDLELDFNRFVRQRKSKPTTNNETEIKESQEEKLKDIEDNEEYYRD